MERLSIVGQFRSTGTVLSRVVLVELHNLLLWEVSVGVMPPMLPAFFYKFENWLSERFCLKQPNCVAMRADTSLQVGRVEQDELSQAAGRAIIFTGQSENFDDNFLR